ncbi:uncharacterized protein [Bemisia tabaci]|uniref:uncharacterized protein n=1 Tax=Bemisia tabaci TaxID=7038 RepID=UPI003B27D4A9
MASQRPAERRDQTTLLNRGRALHQSRMNFFRLGPLAFVVSMLMILGLFGMLSAQDPGQAGGPAVSDHVRSGVDSAGKATTGTVNAAAQGINTAVKGVTGKK